MRTTTHTPCARTIDTTPRMGVATDQGPRPSQCDAAATGALPDGAWAAALVDGYGPHPDVPSAAARAARTAVRAALSSGSATAALESSGRTFDRHDGDGWPEPDAVGAVVVGTGQVLHIAWTGDVRVYVHTEGRSLRRLTSDHTEGARLRALIAAGEPVAEDPAEHDHIVTSTLGRLPVNPANMGTTTHTGPWTAVLLVSDGVHAALADAELHRIVATTADPDACAAALVTAARAADARAGEDAVDDNATAIVVRSAP